MFKTSYFVSFRNCSVKLQMVCGYNDSQNNFVRTSIAENFQLQQFTERFCNFSFCIIFWFFFNKKKSVKNDVATFNLRNTVKLEKTYILGEEKNIL